MDSLSAQAFARPRLACRTQSTFLGKRLRADSEFEMGNRYDVRIEGTRIRHRMGPVSIKIYDKFGQILRIEVTIYDVRFLPHYREVGQRNGKRIMKWTKMKKSIYSRNVLQVAVIGPDVSPIWTEYNY
jgi:hypothetical protein